MAKHAKRFYRLLLLLYPARFREEYAVSIERQFWDEYRSLTSFRQRAFFWLQTAADLGLSIPTEFARELRQDLGYALRFYRRRRTTTMLTMLALALGIGASTGIFSAVNAVLIRELPYPEPERLVEAERAPANAFDGRSGFQRWRATCGYLQDAAAYTPGDVTLDTGHGAVLRVPLAEVSANFFSVLGAAPLFGRGFDTGEDDPGRAPTAILSDRLWHDAFGADPNVLGASIFLNGTEVAVVGVAAPGVEYPARTALWTSSVFDLNRIPKFGAVGTFVCGRVKTGMTLREAQRRYQADRIARGQQDRADLILLSDRLAERIRTASLLLLAVAFCLLLMACANAAHLLLTRSTERHSELVIRAALGASRARLQQQLVTEGCALTITGAAVGLAVAWGVAKLAESALPPMLASQSYTVLDWRVSSFAAFLAVLSGLVCGAISASTIGHSLHGLPVQKTARLRAVLLSGQAVLTVLLLAGSYVLSRGFVCLLDTDLGFEASHVITLTVSLAGTHYDKRSSDLTIYYRAALARMRSIPGVDSAGATEAPPFSSAARMAGSFTAGSGAATGLAQLVSISPGYLRTIRTPILAGRDFNDTDSPATTPQTVIVSASVAQALGGAPLAVGQTLANPFAAGRPWTIIGVAGDIHADGPAAAPALTIYRPVTQAPPGSLTYVLKVRGDVAPYLAVCANVLRSIDPAVPIYGADSLDHALGLNLARPRFYTAAGLFGGGFALLLAVLALYGAVSYSIEQRRHELGVRTALGASPEGMRLMLLRKSALPIAIGMLAGAAVTWSLGPVVRLLIPTAEPPGLAISTGTALLLTAAAAGAVWIATGRILRLDLKTSLRAE